MAPRDVHERILVASGDRRDRADDILSLGRHFVDLRVDGAGGRQHRGRDDH